MQRTGWFILGLTLALATAIDTPAPGAEAPKALGKGPSYESLAKLPVMHEGRRKPFDTLAREEVKQIFGRETIKLLGPHEKVEATWSPVAALFNWSVQPEFWDDQPFILVEYIPLKRLLLGNEIDALFGAIARNEKTSEAVRARIKELEASDNLNAADLSKLASMASISDSDRKGLESLAEDLSEPHKWLSPRRLESARIKVDDQNVEFNTWFRELAQRKSKSDADPNAPRLTDVEKRAIEVGTRLVHYQAIRDRSIKSVEPMLVMPRPSNPTYLAYCGAAFEKARENQGIEGLTPLELDSANALLTYYKDIPREDWKEPGKGDAEFDQNFTNWLRQNSVWIPLQVFLETNLDELTKAGFPTSETDTFLTSFRALESAEQSTPGAAPKEKAAAFVTASRALGTKLNAEYYPTTKAIDLETHFNETNPFFKAPLAYGLALAFLAMSLGFTSNREKARFWLLGSVIYWVGMLGLIAGIALEILGFKLRIQISGWAPVTNMYETVIWVALVTAVLALIFELIYRSKFAAVAGAGVSLLGTVLAANVSILDPGIHSLQPVLRSNYWLVIHVLTEVSSYAAFALAMGLGLIATLYYLTATYRRSPGLVEVSAPLFPGVPMFIVGMLGLGAYWGWFGDVIPADKADLVCWVSAVLANLGGSLAIIGGGAFLGELIARLRFREEAYLTETGATSAIMSSSANGSSELAPPATSVQTVLVEEQGGAVATATKPTVAEIRARAAQSRPKLDARGLAMQETAAKIKPLSNFIYRTMQVGVLLIAAGTILGGVWADYSWGRFWGWDPKEVWALITLLVYLIPLHGRFAGWVSTFGLINSSIVCFMSVVMAWYGVNFVLGVGLHSYGFVEGGSQGAVMSVVIAVLSISLAAAWRRSLASRTPTPTA